uniref:Uncharacterized protein n=1 Tax=Megaselia scalaris TaxID=36166 RepID=T1GYQ2_MEGSC
MQSGCCTLRCPTFLQNVSDHKLHLTRDRPFDFRKISSCTPFKGAEHTCFTRIDYKTSKKYYDYIQNMNDSTKIV